MPARNDGWMVSLRWKFALAFGKSILFAIATVFVGYSIVTLLQQSKPFEAPIAWVVNHIGSTAAMVLVGSVLVLLYFFWFSRQIVDYLAEITHGLREIAKGKLDHELEVKTSDELGVVAETVNQMARQLQQSIEEERTAERMKNDLITGVSHDLRTPLTSILGYLELIENSRYRDEVELHYYVNIAYEKTVNLKKLIDDLFDYTYLHNHGLQPNLAPLRLTAILQQLAEEFVPSLTAAGMSCRLFGGGSDLLIRADAKQLVRAFENLISNAIRYGRDGQFVDIRIDRQADEAVVQVVNYGEPIPPQDIPFIFDRFYRVDKARTSHAGGTGLGLAITRSIVQMHGGSISVRSGRAETVFETRFPLTLNET